MMVERIEVVGRGSRTFVQNIFLRPKEKLVNVRPSGGTVTVGEFNREVPKEAKKAYERGVKEAERKNYEKAVTHFQQAVVSYPRYVQAINDLGVQYLRLNRHGEALAAFEQAIEIEPRTPHPYINIGYIRLQQKEFAQAAESLRKAVEMDSANWSAHMLYGVALTQTEQFEQAQRELERALSLGPPPEASVVRLQLANLFMRRRDFPRAIEQMENYLSEVPKAQDADHVREMIKRLKSAR
jgi:Flp pilus assembly protein TadD